MDLDISLAPEILFNLGPLPITNTFFWIIIISIVIITIAVNLRSRLKEVPGLIQNVFEVLIEFGYGFVFNVVGDHKKSKMIFPLVLTLFVFILCSNLFPYIIPGQSAWTLSKGDTSVPIFRAVMSDYGMVLVLTLLVVITTQIAALWVHGPFDYVGKFINISGITKFFKLLVKGKFKISILLQGGLDFILGLMDLLSEFMKIVSLSFRLFGNIFVGEVLMAVMLALFPYFLPLPFMFLGLLSAIVQAFVFSMLTLISIAMAIEVEEAA